MHGELLEGGPAAADPDAAVFTAGSSGAAATLSEPTGVARAAEVTTSDGVARIRFSSSSHRGEID